MLSLLHTHKWITRHKDHREGFECLICFKWKPNILAKPTPAYHRMDEIPLTGIEREKQRQLSEIESLERMIGRRYADETNKM